MDSRDQQPSRETRRARRGLSAIPGDKISSPRGADWPPNGNGPQDAVQAFFARVGGIVVRFRYLVVAVWLLIAVAATIGLPSLSSVTNNDTSSLLPSGEPSVRAARLAAPFQHGTLPQSVFVASRSNGPLTAADEATITRVEEAVILLIVVLLGAGTDYGLFFVFRMREEMRRGLDLHAAVIKSLSRVGEIITFSAGTVIAALLCLLLASFGLYQGLGPAMAIGVGILLLAGLTLLPALFAIFGRTAFWPTAVRSGRGGSSIWGRIAGRVVQRPAPVLLTGVALFAGLAGYGLLTYSPVDFGNGPTATSSQSAHGTSVLLAHFPAAQANPTNLLLRYGTPVWNHPATLTQATRRLTGDPVFRSVSGPLDPNGTRLSAAHLQRLHGTLGPASTLPITPPAGTLVSPTLYNAYRATPQFISPDGRTVQFDATLKAGASDSTGAMHAIPRIRATLARAGQATGAVETGVTGLAAYSYDTGAISDRDLALIVPVVLVVLALLLAIVLRSLVAPLYLIASVGLSYLAALGLAVVIFVGIGHGAGLILYLPFLMFIFLMALGSDYNILVMSRIREEALERPLAEAVTRAVSATGGTVTSAGIILAATFFVLTLAGGAQGSQVGAGIAGGILLDTFLVRTLFIPSTVVLLRRWNWWPTRLAADPVGGRKSA